MKTALSPAHAPVAANEIGSHQYLGDMYAASLQVMIETCEHNLKVAHREGQLIPHNELAGYNVLWEHHHVGIRGTRQTGKGYAIIRLVTPEDALVVYNDMVRIRYIKRCEEEGITELPFIITAYELSAIIKARPQKVWPHAVPKRIFIMDDLYVFEKLLCRKSFAKFIFKNFARCTPTIVSVG